MRHAACSVIAETASGQGREFLQALGDPTRIRLDAGRGAVHRRDVDLPRLCPAAQQLGLETSRRQRVAWAGFFEQYDAVLAPVMPTAAFPHDTAVRCLRTAAEVGQSTTLVARRRGRPPR